MTTYNYTYIKKYESPFGYRWEQNKLPYWLTIEIVKSDDSKIVYIHSTIHQTSIKELPHSYSLDFTDMCILKDNDLYNYVSAYL